MTLKARKNIALAVYGFLVLLFGAHLIYGFIATIGAALGLATFPAFLLGLVAFLILWLGIPFVTIKLERRFNVELTMLLALIFLINVIICGFFFVAGGSIFFMVLFSTALYTGFIIWLFAIVCILIFAFGILFKVDSIEDFEGM